MASHDIGGLGVCVGHCVGQCVGHCVGQCVGQVQLVDVFRRKGLGIRSDCTADSEGEEGARVCVCVFVDSIRSARTEDGKYVREMNGASAVALLLLLLLLPVLLLQLPLLPCALWLYC